MQSTRCNRCKDQATQEVRTRHFGAEQVCDGCAKALLEDVQTREIPQPPPRNVTINQIIVRLASHEWGNLLMKQAAIEAADQYPHADYLYILVHEHAGWYLAWFREKPGDELVCIDSANDMAKWGDKAAEIRRKLCDRATLVNGLPSIDRKYHATA